MLLADLSIRNAQDTPAARRKVHRTMLMLTGDAQHAARVVGEFSDLTRRLASGGERVTVHVGLVRNGNGRSLQLDCVTGTQPVALEARRSPEGWHVTRAHPATTAWVEQETIDRIRELITQRSREELLAENNALLRKTLAARTESLNRLAQEFGSIQDLDTLLARVLSEARGVFNCEAGSVLMQEDGQLRFRHAANEASDESERLLVAAAAPVYLPIDRTSMAGAAALDDLVVVRDAHEISATAAFQFNRAFDDATGFRTRAVISVAMRSSQHELLGVLQLINPRDAESGLPTEFNEDDQKLVIHFGGLAAMAIERSSMTRALVMRMIKMAQLNDPKETGAHVRRVSEVSARLFLAWARKRGLSEDEIFKQLDQLRPAAMLHDVGKVGIPQAVLRKPGPLDAAERLVMERHTAIGASTLVGVRTSMDESVRNVTLYHHARWDGTGYPKQAEILATLRELGVDTTHVPEPKGEGIPLAARLVAIADVFDALMSRRAYKPAWTPEQVRAEFESARGSHFDPELVDLFLADFDEHCRIHATIVDEEPKASEATPTPAAQPAKPPAAGG